MANINATSLRDALVRLLRATPQQVDFGSDTGPLRGRAVGDVLRAQVVAQLPNGRSIVEVDGAPFDVKLPVAVSTGDTLELEVLAALAEGLTNKAIARRLNISLHTVKFHVESLFRKLGARTRTEADRSGAADDSEPSPSERPRGRGGAGLRSALGAAARAFGRGRG